MKTSPLGPFRLVLSLSLFLLLVSTTLSAESPPSAGTTLAAHLATVEQVAGRLQRQIAHPEGRPEAEEELALLIDHLERLQVATAATEAELGTQLEDLRLSLLGRIRRGEQLAPREPGKPSPGEPAPVAGSGIITGQVLGTGNVPLANVWVAAWRSNGSYWDAGYTDSQGVYLISGVPDGSYFVASDFYSSVYLNETYDDLQCASYGPCQLDQATPVVIAGGSSATGINFKLSEGGKLRGRVYDHEGLPVAGVMVKALSADGALKGSGVTDAAGRFLISKLLTGTYYLATSSALFSDEVYPNLPCEGLLCTLTEGVAISLELEQQILGLDFTLARRSTLRGRVQDSESANPIRYADVTVYNEAGYQVRRTYTDDLGKWQLSDLEPGVYYAAARDYDHQSMLYQGIVCDATCNPTSGTAITLAAEATLSDIDFMLPRLGEVTGSVSTADSQLLPNGWIDIYNANGYWVDSDPVGAGDATFKLDRLNAGNHFLRASNFLGYQQELWQDVPCPTSNSCQVITSGTPIVVALGQTTTGIDVVIDPLGRIEGRVLSSDSGAPVVGAYVQAYNAGTGYFVTSAQTDADGRYRLQGLNTGNFKVKAASSAHRAELWNGIVCGDTCVIASGHDVAVTFGETTSGIDFSLERFGYIRGTVRDQATQAPMGYSEVEIFDAAGNYRGYITTAADGTYTTFGLQDGTYYALAKSSWSQRDYLRELYSGIDCHNCSNITSSTPITVNLNSETTGVDFTLLKGGTLAGTGVAAQSGLSASVWVSVYDSNGLLVANSYGSGSQGYIVEGLAAGSYFLIGRSDYQLASEVWPGVICPPQNTPCNPLLGTAVAVTLGATTTVNFAFDRLGELTGQILDSETGAPLSEGSVYVYDSYNNGHYESVDAEGRYHVEGLHPGDYKVVSRNNDQHIDRVLGGAACENTSCDLASGTPIAVQMSQVTQAPDFLLDFGPGIAGWVRREGTAAAGVGIDVWSSSGIHLATAASDANGRFRVAVSSGFYYVTTDNGPLFMDEVWNEVSCPDGPAYLGLCNPLLGDIVAPPAGQPALDVIVFDLESRTAVFRDGFESGHVGNWSQSFGFVEP